jgi:transposase InsO family protein
VRFAFIFEHNQAYPTEYPIKRLCELFEVTRGGYYKWLKRDKQGPGPRARRSRDLEQKIRQKYEKSGGRYGSPKVYRELKLEGEQVSENTVAKVMRQQGLHSIIKKRFRVCTTDSNHEHPVAPNRLNQQFQQKLPDRVWCADITFIPTDQGWLYLAAVIDLCSRKIVGWAMADHMRASLCVEALEMAAKQRNPAAGLLHHSDRGVQYACHAYQQKLAELQMTCSMSRVGNCYDNAVMESFGIPHKALALEYEF